MDRRLFLTGMLSLAGAAALASVVQSNAALAAVPNTRGGVLDELDSPTTDFFEDEETQSEVEQVQYGRGRRRRRRRAWRRVCSRYWRRGRMRVRCYRRRVWIWGGF